MHLSSSGVAVTSSSGGTIVNGHRSIEIELLLPNGSGLHSKTGLGSIHAVGHLAVTKIDAGAGTVDLASVGRAEIDAASGAVRIGTVTQWADINAASGPVKVTCHAGRRVRVRAASGSITFTIAAEASGTVDIHSATGSITLHGSHRPDMTINATTLCGSVRRP
ncbi:DUF4097 family beta strand repeat-containing protein [Streptomyces sp. NPDC057654]|uniref:DUF4097 family beta strand repeat-containing protein n=1 Tax=Streptomyces sp. NPDC057654 TaxID=3346196 RepID=UPI0036C81F91